MPASSGAARGRAAGRLRLAGWIAALVALLCAGSAGAQEPRALQSDSLRVVFWPGHRPIAERTLRAARAPLLLPGIPDRAVPLSGTVVLAPDEAAFRSIARRAPEWSAGVAIPGRRLIILPAYASPRTPLDDPITALRHELVHLALDQYLDAEIPRWFQEGYATWASGGWDESAGWQIRLALLRGTAPPLDSLSLGWPASAPRARLAYLLSASAVRFLAERNGERAFAIFLRDWRESGDLDAAFRGTYGMTLTQFEKEWRVMVKRRYGWLLVLAQVGTFWAAVTVLFFVAGIARRRHNRARMAQLELEDRMLPPPSDPEDGVDEEWRQE